MKQEMMGFLGFIVQKTSGGWATTNRPGQFTRNVSECYWHVEALLLTASPTL